MKLRKILLFIFVLVFGFFALVGCTNNGGNQGNGGNEGGNGGEPSGDPSSEEDEWANKEVSKLDLVNETFTATYEYDEFELSMLKIKVTYTDGTSRVISVDESMLSEKDLGKLKSTGTPRITIEYEGEEITAKVKLTDSSKLDEDLNKDGLYACVIKAIRDKEAGVINFYLEINVEYDVCALNFAYSFNSELMQVSNAQMNSELTGVGNVRLENDKIIFAYSENARLFEDDILLFTVHYEGDFRNSGLGVLESYNNVVYVADMETYETTPVSNVLYHASVK